MHLNPIGGRTVGGFAVDNTPRRLAFRILCAILLMAGTVVGAPGAEARILLPIGDQVDITAVVLEGQTAESCAADLTAIAAQAQLLSDATSPPFGLSPNLRAFYDSVLRLGVGGEARSLGQISHSYVAGYSPARVQNRAIIVTSVRVEVSRPPGTPPGGSSRLAVAWEWLERLAETRDAETGLVAAQPRMHRFDFSGEIVRTHRAVGRATADCRAGVDGQWFGAVLVWTTLPP